MIQVDLIQNTCVAIHKDDMGLPSGFFDANKQI